MMYNIIYVYIYNITYISPKNIVKSMAQERVEIKH